MPLKKLGAKVFLFYKVIEHGLVVGQELGMESLDKVGKHILFADVIIETRGGREIIARGFDRCDADNIKRLLSF